MLKVRDVMTRDVLTLTPESSLRDAADLFACHHISGAPVVSGNIVVGVVTAMDVVEFLSVTPLGENAEDGMELLVEHPTLDGWGAEDVPGALYFTEQSRGAGDETSPRFQLGERTGDVFAEHTVDEIMTVTVRWLSPETSIVAAADFIQDAGVHRMLVLEHGRLAGIVTTSDVTRGVAQGRLGTRRAASLSIARG